MTDLLFEYPLRQISDTFGMLSENIKAENHKIPISNKQLYIQYIPIFALRMLGSCFTVGSGGEMGY